jgi:alcohol dehydrogenase, propanol-preferring
VLALQLRPDQEWPVLVEVDAPVPGPGEILLRVKAAGICRTDLHLIHTFRQGLERPVILGHEIAGEVVAGEGHLGTLRPGQLVVAHHKLVCHECRQCLLGRETLCERASVLGIDRDGGFEEYVTTQASRVLPLPSTIPPAVGAALTCGGVTAFHALRTIGQVSPSETVVILGTGGVGLFAVQLARSSGAEVIAADIRPEALRRATSLGAHRSIEVNPEDPGQLSNELGSNAADLVIDLVGDSRLVTGLLAILRPGGRYVVTSGPPDERLAVSPFALFRRELRLLGSRGSSLAELQEVLEMAAGGRLDASIAVEAPLSESSEMLRRVDEGGVVGRAVLVP